MPSHENTVSKTSCFQKHFFTLMLAVIMLFGFGIRLYQLGDRSIWFDESFSGRIVQFSFLEMYERLSEDIHPPAYYTILKLWRYLVGDSILGLRLLSVIFSTVSILLIYQLTRSLAKTFFLSRKNQSSARLSGLIAAAFFAVNIFQIRQAWELRMYSMGIMLTLLSSYLLFSAFYQPKRSWKTWTFYSLTVTFCLYTHYSTLFAIAGQFLFMIFKIVMDFSDEQKKHQGQKHFKYAIISVSLFILLFLPWLPTFIQQKKLVDRGWWDAPFQSNQIFEVMPRLLVPDMVYGFSWTACYLTFVIFIICYFLVLFYYRMQGFFLFCVGFVPFLLVVIQSMYGTNLMVDRFLSYQQPFILIAMALAITLIPISILKYGLSIFLILCGLDAYCIYMEKLDIPNAPGAKAAAIFLQQHVQPHEKIIASNPLIYFPVLFYLGPESGAMVYDEYGRKGFAHFCGPQLLRTNDVVTRYEMDKMLVERIWTISSTGSWGGNDFPFYIPETWEKDGAPAIFSDVFSCPTDYLIQAYVIKKTTHAKETLGD